MKIAVTAASGKLGAQIVKALVSVIGNENVVGLARNTENAKQLGIEVRPGDYAQPDALEKSLDGIDTLLLVSAMDSPDLRITLHRNVINAAKNAGVKKIVYTSVQGAEEGTAFSPIIQSNRQTEQDVKSSGLDWVIGRNGIYIEPDVEYIDTYKAAGEISNCAGDGKCAYTTRDELAFAYAKLLTEDSHNGETYNLNGEAITQTQLANFLNDAFDTNLNYKPVSVEEYRQNRVEELGEFIGTVISGIYQGILDGKLDNPSDFKKATGRAHVSWEAYFSQINHTLQ
jgi:NAD(P)H dehydrogenase (quinone)